MRKLLSILILFVMAFQLNAQTKRAMTIEDMWSMKRVGAYSLSPDGKTIAFAVTAYKMETNKGKTEIYLVDSDGSNLRHFVSADVSTSRPTFMPDGKSISYLKKGQLWAADLDGSNDHQITDIYTGVNGYVWNKTGDKLLLISEVYPNLPDQAANQKYDEEKDASPVKASILTELMYRNFDHWRGEKRSHLFLYNVNTKDLTDITFKSNSEVPPVDLTTDAEYVFSPDGTELAFTINNERVVATSTNNDVFIVKLNDIKKGEAAPAKMISVSKGNDCQPVYSPDGKYIAFTSMARAGFEADKKSIVIYDRATGKLKNISEKIDLTAGQLVWSPDSKYIYFDAPFEVLDPIYKINVATSELTTLVKDHMNSGLSISPDGKTLFFEQQRSTKPLEIFSVNVDGGVQKQLTYMNKGLLSQLAFNEIETFWSKGANGAKVESIIIKPPFFDPAKKYPLIFLIHGGPQGHWEDDFHYRWNIQLFASRGYVVIATNPRGSTGYGQKFTDEISRDWGGKVYTDLMNALDFALAKFNFIDKKNVFAAGASYGGYMINWIEGHTNRFNALVSHDGGFDLESMYGTTEELWFPNWEYGGPYWTNKGDYDKWSPNRYIKNFKTPMLIIHGGQDFRLTEGQAMELFTALQLMKVESKFLYFPDETHFVTKPQNARLWWTTVFDWFEKHKK